MEANAGERQAKYHTRSRPDHYISSADFVDPLECEKSEDEVRSRDYEPHSCRLVEPNIFEQCCGIVHQGIESAQLLKGLHSASHN